MTEKTEWELIDAPSSDTQSKPGHLLKKLLGPWWRWKLAGAATVASMALVFFATLAGMIILLVLAGTILSFGIGKLRRWLHH